ncbi:protease pro-enzyme activation domain-containing protein, partial [Rudaeicoccus suwonensis]
MRHTTRLIALTATGGLAIAFAGVGAGTAHAASSGRDVVNATPTWTSHALKRGAVAAGQQHTFSIVLNMRNEAGAEALANAVSDPSSPSYGKYVTAAKWRSEFAPTNQQVSQVSGWLRSQGIKVLSTPANHRYLQVMATTSEINSAFHTTMSTYSLDGAAQTAPNSTLTVPQSISSLVAGVVGLDSTQKATPTSTTGVTSTAQLRTGSSTVAPAKATSDTTLPGPPAAFVNAGPCSAYYGQKKASTLPKLVQNPMSYAVCGYKPAQIRGAYGVDSELQQGYDGRGVTVA